MAVVEDFHRGAHSPTIKGSNMTVNDIPGLEDCQYRLKDLNLGSNGGHTTDAVDSPTARSDELAKLRSLVSSYENENKVLKQKFKESLQTKSKWQAYDRSRDDLVNRLETEKRQLQAKLSQVRPSDLMSSERDDVILYWQRKAEEEESMRKRLEEVNRGHELFIQNLQLALQQSQRNGVDRERIELLENQVTIFSEDFEQERRDRERAQARVSELEEKLHASEMQLRQFQDDTMSRMSTRRRHTMNSYKAEYDRQLALTSCPSTTTSSRLIPHGVYHYTNPDIDGEISEDEDCVGELPMSHSLIIPTKKIETLDCPKCHKQFPTSDPMSFLEHNDICS